MKKMIILVFLATIFCKVNAQKSIAVADTIVAGSVEKNYLDGFKAFNIYIEKNVRPPVIAYENQKVGKTYVSFIIEPDGSISNIYTILAAGSGMDEELIRVINASRNWSPTKIDDKPVRTFCRAGVQFFADFEKHSMWVSAQKID